MNKQTHNSTIRRLAITSAASALLGLGAMTSGIAVAQSGVKVPLILAATEGGDRRDTRQDCRDEEGVGKDKRDCKQEGRQERNKDG